MDETFSKASGTFEEQVDEGIRAPSHVILWPAPGGAPDRAKTGFSVKEKLCRTDAAYVFLLRCPNQGVILRARLSPRQSYNATDIRFVEQIIR